MAWGGWGGLFLSLGRPTQEQQKSCLAAAGGFNYDAALRGASSLSSYSSSSCEKEEETDAKSLVERGFFVNRSRLLLGSGAATFSHAKSAVRSWRHLALGWAEVEPDTPVKKGTRFCICYKDVIPCWVTLPLQIAYVVDDAAVLIRSSSSSSSTNGGGAAETTTTTKKNVFAFGSGTLQGHLLAGEERFSVQLDEDGRVWYDVLSFSKPAHPLSTLCYPYVQLRQKHFAHHSGQALLRHLSCAAAPSSEADPDAESSSSRVNNKNQQGSSSSSSNGARSS